MRLLARYNSDGALETDVRIPGTLEARAHGVMDVHGESRTSPVFSAVGPPLRTFPAVDDMGDARWRESSWREAVTRAGRE